MKMASMMTTFSVLLLAGYSSADEQSATTEVSPSQSPTVSPSASPTVDPQAPRGQLIADAEATVKGELPDAPIWEGMKFKGTYVSDQEVCVDRTFKDGKIAGFVVVTFPERTTGKPQDGLCSSAKKPTPVAPAIVPENLQGRPGLIRNSDLNEAWPLTVTYGLLDCKTIQAGGLELQSVTFTDPAGKHYAVNGTAKSHTNFGSIDPIWKDNPDVEGLKIDIGQLIERGRAFC